MATARLMLDVSEVAAVSERADDLGLDLTIVPKAQVVDPITAVLLVGGVLALAQLVVELVDRAKGGLLIDLREAPTEIRRDPSIPAGYVVVIAVDGAVKVDVHDAPKNVTERLVGQIVDKAFGTAKDVAEAVRDALGADRATEGSA